MKKSVFSTVILLAIAGVAIAQNVGIGTKTPAASAQLDVTSTTKGFLPPRMTAAQRIDIPSPAEGLLVFQTDSSKGYYYFINGLWTSLTEEKTYPTVTICNQTWMDKNLDVSTYRNGDSIPHVTNIAEWFTLTSGAWCYVNNDPSMNATYGKLYNWYAVDDPRGLAPSGWHVPTDDEWTTLETCLGGSLVAGAKMKVPAWHTWQPSNFTGTNSSAWAGLPGSGLFYNGGLPDFSSVGTYGLWWSSTEASSDPRYYLRGLSFDSKAILKASNTPVHGFSVRCLRD